MVLASVFVLYEPISGAIPLYLDRPISGASARICMGQSVVLDPYLYRQITSTSLVDDVSMTLSAITLMGFHFLVAIFRMGQPSSPGQRGFFFFNCPAVKLNLWLDHCNLSMLPTVLLWFLVVRVETKIFICTLLELLTQVLKYF